MSIFAGASPALALLSGVVLGFVGSVPAAGPLLLLVIESGIRGDRRSALALAVGGALAEGLYVLVAFAGLSRLLSGRDELALYARALSALVLLCVGVLLLRRAPPQTEKPAQRAAGAALGFSLVGSNPAFLAFWSAVAAALYASDILPAEPANAPWLAVGASAGIVLWFWMVLGVVERQRERIPRVLLVHARRAFGVALCAFALYVAAGMVWQR